MAEALDTSQLLKPCQHYSGSPQPLHTNLTYRRPGNARISRFISSRISVADTVAVVRPEFVVMSLMWASSVLMDL
jgi:hypothetical protein